MQKIIYILSVILLLLTSCSNDSDVFPDNGSEKNISIRLMPASSILKTIDGDNLAIEQTVNNVSVFFAEPSSNIITSKYVYSGFTDLDDYKLVTLPLDPATLQAKDIYVITNYNDASALNAVATIDDIKALQTPAVSKTNNLSPSNGICMYGENLNFDFSTAGNTDVIVNVVRTGAKYRISVEFPENPTLSTNNTYLLENAARYTYVVQNTSASLPSTAYYTYAAAIHLTYNGAVYTDNAYVYEADNAPNIYIYTHMSNMTGIQTFSTQLPKPQRNYLYDIKIQVYSGQVPTQTKSATSIIQGEGDYYCSYTIDIYNESGQKVSL
ncbi:MAG: DUF4906 domain-containing protein [Dysgonomonas sp.]|nr:DUF4906 domain-containing protein [Dysgonomonas sp.]